MYAHLATSLGWTWQYIRRHVNIPMVESLNKYWEGCPPTHIMVAAYLGIKPKKEASQINTDESIKELLEMFPSTDKHV